MKGKKKSSDLVPPLAMQATWTVAGEKNSKRNLQDPEQAKHLYPKMFPPIFSHNDRHTCGWNLIKAQHNGNQPQIKRKINNICKGNK